ncbi:MAG TPA: DUF4303 domain-containing protein, partial [Tepidisphaeraceae bacterium]|nr:DUF4303 domain-containing protein [Tepidisphaeraceae bacterium]
MKPRTLDTDQLLKKVTDAARKAFTSLTKSHPDETFYAFALYTDESAMTIIPAATSEESIERRLGGYGKLSPQSRKAMRWSTGEWAYESVGADREFDSICKTLAKGGYYDPDDDEAHRAHFSAVFETMVRALEALDKEGLFGKGKAREQVTLF